MQKILHYSQFENDPFGNGGNRRTAQITELVSLSNFTAFNLNNTKPTLFQRYNYGLKFFLKYHPRLSFSRYNISMSGHESFNYLKTFEQYSGEKLIIWERTIDYVTPYIAKSKGFKTIAMPQNLESFVNSHQPSSKATRLSHEIYHLSQADKVFCISREEQWLLNLWGINADYLPYYPPHAVLESLIKIRERRESTSKQKFLILGTATNMPTFMGMVEQIEWLKEIRKNLDFEVDIAGYGTERLKDYCADSSFNLLGSIEFNKLNYLLTHAKAILIHQKTGAGALTRIPEMLIAGIPVISNANASRSAFYYSGVYCYDSKLELLNLIMQNFNIPEILLRPIKAEKRFINCLQELIR